MVHVVLRAKTMKTLPDHQAADVDSLYDLGLFNLPRVADRTLMSMAVIVHYCLFTEFNDCVIYVLNMWLIIL